MFSSRSSVLHGAVSRSDSDPDANQFAINASQLLRANTATYFADSQGTVPRLTGRELNPCFPGMRAGALTNELTTRTDKKSNVFDALGA